MSSLVIYLIKANIALTLFYLAYRFGLRRLTFYTLNRFFLLFGIAFSAIFPLVNLDAYFQQHQQLAGSVAYYAPDWNTLQQYVQPQNQFTVWTLIAYVFWAGVIVMAIRFCMQMLSLLRVHLRTKAGFLQEEKIRFMHDRINPFSFFKNIYINPELHSENEIEKILKHEKIHAKEWHSADVLAGEINNIFYWFNPGAWLMKTAIQENLEFITDRKIISSGMDAKSYQYSLIKMSAIPFANPLANNFNFSHLKKRIKMMNKKRSSRFHLLRYLLLLPVIAIAAFIINSSRAQTVSTQGQTASATLHFDTLQVLKKIPKNQYFNESGYAIRVMMGTGKTTVLSKAGIVFGPFNIFSMSPEQLNAFNEDFGSKATYKEVQAMKNHTAYINSHPEISDYSYISADKILVWEGKSSRIYNLLNAHDKNELLKKYGSIPPVYGRFADGAILPKIKYMPPIMYRDSIPLPYQDNSLPADYITFLRENPSVKSLEWYLIKDMGPALIHVELKNGTVESYHLYIPEERKKAEAKYGKIPAPPPPPPPAPAKVKSNAFNNIHDTSIRNDYYYAQLSYQKAREKDYDDAERYANESLNLNPDNAKATNVLRYVHQMKEYNEKMEAYRKEREKELAPKSTRDKEQAAYDAQLSYQLAKNKRYNDAMTVAQDALKLDPDNAMAKQVLRYVNQMKGYQEKIEEYEKTHKDTDSAPAHAVNFHYPINYHGSLSKASSGITTLYPAPPVDRIFGSNQTLPEKVIGGKYYGYNLKGGTKNTVNTLLTHSIASKVNYGIKDTTNTYTLTQTISETRYESNNKKGNSKKGEKISTPYPYTLSIQETNVVKDTGKVLDNSKEFPEKALYILNGKEVSIKHLKESIQPEDIYSISVLKGPLAVSRYGLKAKDGAIKIYTKEFVKEHPYEF